MRRNLRTGGFVRHYPEEMQKIEVAASIVNYSDAVLAGTGSNQTEKTNREGGLRAW